MYVEKDGKAYNSDGNVVGKLVNGHISVSDAVYNALFGSNSGSQNTGGSSASNTNTSTPIEQPKQSPKPMELEGFKFEYNGLYPGTGLTASKPTKSTGISTDKNKNVPKKSSGTYSPINIMVGETVVVGAVVKDGVSYGNIKDLVEGLGGKVNYESKTGIVTATYGDRTIIYYTRNTTKDNAKKKAWTFEVVDSNGKNISVNGSNQFSIIGGKTQTRVKQFCEIFGLEKDFDYIHLANDKNVGAVLIRPTGLAANDKFARSNIIEWTKELTGSSGYYFNDFGQLKYDALKDGKDYKPFSATADAMLKAAINNKNFIYAEDVKKDGDYGYLAPETGYPIENMGAGGFYYGDAQMFPDEARGIRIGRHARVWMNSEYVSAGAKEDHSDYSKDTIYTPLSTDFIHELSHAIRWNIGNDESFQKEMPKETEAWAVYTQNTIIKELQKSVNAGHFKEFKLRTDGNEGLTRDANGLVMKWKGEDGLDKEPILIPGLDTTYNAYGKFTNKGKVNKDINDAGGLANYIKANYN